MLASFLFKFLIFFCKGSYAFLLKHPCIKEGVKNNTFGTFRPVHPVFGKFILAYSANRAAILGISSKCLCPGSIPLSSRGSVIYISRAGSHTYFCIIASLSSLFLNLETDSGTLPRLHYNVSFWLQVLFHKPFCKYNHCFLFWVSSRFASGRLSPYFRLRGPGFDQPVWSWGFLGRRGPWGTFRSHFCRLRPPYPVCPVTFPLRKEPFRGWLFPIKVSSSISFQTNHRHVK